MDDIKKPASTHLFTVSEEQKAQLFHHIVVKLPYL